MAKRRMKKWRDLMLEFLGRILLEPNYKLCTTLLSLSSDDSVWFIFGRWISINLTIICCHRVVLVYVCAKCLFFGNSEDTLSQTPIISTFCCLGLLCFALSLSRITSIILHIFQIDRNCSPQTMAIL